MGERLGERRCARCGAPLAPGVDFCGSCGEDVRSAPGEAPARGYAVGARIDDCEITGLPQVGLLGERYPACDLGDGRAVELRVLRPAPGVPQARVQRFRALLQSLGAVKSGGLQDLRRFVEEDGCFRVVLDAPVGELLSDRLVGSSGAKRALERTLASEVLAGICETLARVHDHSVHGALWPAAIRVSFDRNGALDRVCLDLPGEIWLLPDARVCAHHTPTTAAYVAPELLEGELPAPPADQYAVGVLAYELLTGRLLRGLAPRPGQLVGRLAPAVDRAIDRALSERPAGRYANIGDLGRDLVAALGEPPPPAVEEEPWAQQTTLGGAPGGGAPGGASAGAPEASAGSPAQWLVPAAPQLVPRRSPWSVLAVVLVLLGLGAGAVAYAWEYLPWSAPAPAARGLAQLTLRTVPEGTSVNLDGEDLGFAPITLGQVTPGVTHFLRLSAEGHQLKVVEVRLEPGQRRVLVVRLDPEPPVR